MAFPFDPELARLVQADTLEPHQQPTARAFQTATNFFQRWMLKHPYLSDFHSLEELLHGCLREGERSVMRYVPQPFRLRVGKRGYTPDCYVASESGPRVVVELKPRGEMDDDMKVPLTHFFAQYGYRFEVVSNESVRERQVEAENWLEIVVILHRARELDTVDAEQAVLETLTLKGPCTLGDIVDAGDRERTAHAEIALFRLLHRGQLAGELVDRRLDFDTGFSLCA